MKDVRKIIFLSKWTTGHSIMYYVVTPTSPRCDLTPFCYQMQTLNTTHTISSGVPNISSKSFVKQSMTLSLTTPQPQVPSNVQCSKGCRGGNEINKNRCAITTTLKQLLFLLSTRTLRSSMDQLCLFMIICDPRIPWHNNISIQKLPKAPTHVFLPFLSFLWPLWTLFQQSATFKGILSHDVQGRAAYI